MTSVVDDGQIFADDAQGHHNDAAHDQLKQDHGGEAFHGPAQQPRAEGVYPQQERGAREKEAQYGDKMQRNGGKGGQGVKPRRTRFFTLNLVLPAARSRICRGRFAPRKPIQFTSPRKKARRSRSSKMASMTLRSSSL